LTLLVPDGRADRPEELGPIRRPAAVSPSPTVPPPAEVAPTATTAASPSSPAPVEREWVVQPGESFWSKAEEMRGGVSEAAVIGYWLDLIDANRDRLVRPGDPDLILPGQVFTLPPMEP
jgi:nucleoid-associated protein YgaU